MLKPEEPSGFKHTTFHLALCCRYVEQSDTHLPQATVAEALLFSARLRLPSTVDVATRDKFVGEVRWGGTAASYGQI